MGKIVNLNDYKQNKINRDLGSHLSKQLSIAMHPSKLRKIHPNTSAALEHLTSLSDSTIGQYSQAFGLLHESVDPSNLSSDHAQILRKLLVLHSDVQEELHQGGTINPEDTRPHL
jgi:hypothetical protein